MDHSAIISAYRRYAPVYDLVFGPIFEPGRQRTVKSLDCRGGESVLEVGVGTGLSLRHYPREVSVTGIDISPHMLERADRLARRYGLENVTLHTMDAQQLDFEDDSFDRIAAMYVASVVPDPAAMMKELRRVCRPGGEIIVLNHFTRNGEWTSHVERRLAPLARLLGFHPLFPIDEFIEIAEIEVVENRPVNAFGYWTLLRLRND